MRVAVVSCVGYRDAWEPFRQLFKKFWGRQYDLATDSDSPGMMSWCSIVDDYALSTADDILLMQEDFFLTSPVNAQLIADARKQLHDRNAGMIRLYPCPGADEDYGDQYYGIVTKGSAYRISCQASVWRPDFLHAIASRFNTPAEFETEGTKFAETLPDEVLAFKRDVKPWPLNYLCSAIGRGLWSHDAKRLCDEHGIKVDWSLRGFQPV